MIYDLQKADIWKRISAFLFDSILMGILAVACAFILSMLTGYDTYNERLNGCYRVYEEAYGVTFDVSQEEYLALDEEGQQRYMEAYEALIADEEVLETYPVVVNLTLLIISLGILAALMITEFIIPLYFKNGQTLGKKIFGIGVMRTDGIKINTGLLLIRCLLGKYTIETMIPTLIFIMICFNMVGLMGTLIIGAIGLLQIILIVATKTNSPIHDLMAQTVVVDMASQLIFDTQEDMIAYKKREHAKEVLRQSY